MKALISAVMMAIGSVAFASTTYEWSGGALDGKWSTPGNWVGNAAPVSGAGNEIRVSAANAVNGEIENDLTGLSVGTVVFTGDTPFRLKGSAITFNTSTPLRNEATVAVTNAVDCVLTVAGDNTVYNALGGNGEGVILDYHFCLAGAFSGANAKLVLSGASGARTILAGANTHGGGTKCTIEHGLMLENGQAGGAAGTVIEHNSNIYFNEPGTYDYYFVNTGNGALQWFFSKGGDYVIGRDVTSPNFTAVRVFYPNSRADFGTRASKSKRAKAATGTITFNGRLDMTKADLYSWLGNAWTVKYMAGVTLDRMVGGSSDNDCSSIAEFYDRSASATITPSLMQRVYLKSVNAFTNNPVVKIDKYCHTNTSNPETPGGGIIDLCGNSQTFDRIESSGECAIKEAGTLKSTGGAATVRLEPSRSCYTLALLTGALSLEVAAKNTDYEQTFSNRVHTLSGDITVSQGVLTFAGETACSLKNVQNITIGDGGELKLDTPTASALSGLVSVTVANGGMLRIVRGATPFTDAAVRVHLGATAGVRLPDNGTYHFKSVYINGVQVAGGTYTSLDNFEGENLTIVIDGEAAVATWTGGAGDGRWSSAGNWQGGVLPAVGGAVTVSGAGGAMVNDLADLELANLVFTGSSPITLAGNAITFTEGGTMVDEASAVVTNSVDIALAHDLTISHQGSAQMVLAGVVSGSGRTLDLVSANDNAKFTLLGANTLVGTIRSTRSDTVSVANAAALPAGSTLEYFGSLSLDAAGDYRFDFKQTATTGNRVLYFHVGDTTYNLYGRLYSTTLTGEQRLRGERTKDTFVNFYGEISYPLGKLYSAFSEYWTVCYYAPITADVFYSGDSYASIAANTYLYATNAIGTLSPCYGLKLYVDNDGIFDEETDLVFNRFTENAERVNGYLNFLGHDQTVGAIESDAKRIEQQRGILRSTVSSANNTAVPMTLTIAGSRSAVTAAMVKDAISLVYEAAEAGYVQTFSNRVSDTTGDIHVKCGTFVIGAGASFPNVKKITVDGGARFTLHTTVANALDSLTNVVLAAGAVFEVVYDEAEVVPFPAGNVILDMEAGAVFGVPEGYTFDLKCIYRDGEPVESGTYSHASLEEIVGGSVFARPPPKPWVDAYWTGAAGEYDTSASSGDNWQGGQVPNLANGTVVAHFATGGEMADLGYGSYLNGLVFDGSVGRFQLWINGVDLGGLGITVEAAHTNEVNTSLTLRSSQAWDVGEGSQLFINSTVYSSAGNERLLKDGPGELCLYAGFDSLGEFTLGSTAKNGGMVRVYAEENAFGPESDVYPVTINGVTGQDNQGSVCFECSSTVKRPFVINSDNAYYAYQQGYDTVVTFKKSFTHNGALRMAIRGGSETVFEGGGAFNGWTCFRAVGGLAKWTFREVPITGNYFYLEGSNFEVDLGVAGNALKAIDFPGGNLLRASVPGALASDTTRLIMNHANAVLELAGTQTIGRIEKAAAGTITSSVPATLTFTQMNGANEFPMTNAAVRISGAVKLVKRGASLFVQNCAADTTGGIGVEEGVLRLASNAVFASATDISVTGTGTLEVGAAGLFGRKATFTYASTAAVRLDGDQTVRNLVVDGVRREPGVYGGTASGAANTIAGFSGTGRMIVTGQTGSMLIFQ